MKSLIKNAYYIDYIHVFMDIIFKSCAINGRSNDHLKYSFLWRNKQLSLR